MSAFMAGPGNAKKVVENGSLLSWKLGCSLDQSSVPNINSVQGPARRAACRPGWATRWWGGTSPTRSPTSLNGEAPTKQHPTPVLAVLPPTTVVEPPVRIVPTLFIALYCCPDRELRPPSKPTIKVPSIHRPHPNTGTPSTNKGHGDHQHPPYPAHHDQAYGAKDHHSEAAKAYNTLPGVLIPDPANEKPVLRNPIDQVNALVGTYFEVKIPSDTFFDKEDGTTDKLRLTLRQKHNEVVGETSWIQFNTTSQLLYGLPDAQHVGKHEYFMHATDKGSLNAIDAFEVRVNRWPVNDKSPVIFTARFEGEPRSLTNDIHKKILLVKKLAYALGDRNSSTVSLRNITKGSIVVEWTNTSLPQNPCPKEQIAILSRTLASADGKPSQTFRYSMDPEFRPLDVQVKGRASCRTFSFIPPGEINIPEPPAVTPALGTGRQSTDDVYLHTVIPAVVVAAILLIAGIIAMICYRKKRKGKLTIEDQATFIKKG
ncbi:hypothetical protein KUCAC02_026653, partial [Chaenocephalus aceratus]